jgi:tRNA(Ile)-lysidine synthetase-like protein
MLAVSPLWDGLGDGTIGVACSGGRDSVALARAAHELLSDEQFCQSLDPPPRLHLWHLDHGLRPDSAADAEFVTELADQLGCQCTVQRLQLDEQLASDGGNAEQLARQERYRALLAWLTDLRGLGPAAAMTAHHLGDQAETVLFNLVRGTHLAGLRGIARVRDDLIFRPWLELDPAEIGAYLERLGQPWRDDPSNADTQLARNRIRHQILPALTEINARAREHIARLGDTARAALSYVEGQLANLSVEECGTGTVSSWLPLIGWPTGDYAAHRLADGWGNAELLALYAASQLKDQLGSLSREEHDTIARWSTTPHQQLTIRTGGVNLAGPAVLAVTSQRRRPRPTPEVLLETGATATAGGLRMGLQATTAEAWRRHSLGRPQPWQQIRSWSQALPVLTETPPERPIWRCYLPAGLRLPLTLRAWQEGDRIKLPDGAGKKVGDVFTDAKIPQCFRAVWALLTDAAGEILWIPALADSHWMRIEGDTAPAYAVTLRAEPVKQPGG